jgi:dipeptidyl aminopeptidase/acylaminoacyl peptidase
MRKFILPLFLVLSLASVAQKKPLDHTVYDGWQTITERLIANNGAFVVYVVSPQEGDGFLNIQTSKGEIVATIDRGYSANISEDGKFVVCKIKPTYQQTRTARIQKKLPNESPKDSLAIVTVASKKVEKIARVKSFKMPEKSSTILAYLFEKNVPELPTRKEPDSLARIAMYSKMIDSLTKVADSMKAKLQEVNTKGLSSIAVSRSTTAASAKPAIETVEEGTNLVLLNLQTGEKKQIVFANDYYLDKKGSVVIVKTTKQNGKPNSKALLLKYNVASTKVDTILKGFNDAKSFAIDEQGMQVAFLAERDSSSKALQKFYSLYYYNGSADTAVKLADRFTNGIPNKHSIGEFSNTFFSKSGKRLFTAIAPILPLKDTTLPEFERSIVDVWHYNDDYLQTAQIKNIDQSLRRSYLARYDFDTKSIVPLANEKFERIIVTNEGDGNTFYTTSDYGKRVQRQWGVIIVDVYTVNPVNGTTQLVKANFKGNTIASTTGKYLMLYEDKSKQFSSYNAETNQSVVVAKDIKVSLTDEENDVPDDANPYGIMGWHQNDSAVYVYDKFDIWKIDPLGKNASENITKGLGRTNNITFRNIVLDRDERNFKHNQSILLTAFNNTNKNTGIQFITLGKLPIISNATQALRYSNIVKATEVNTFTFSTETYAKSANVHVLENAQDNIVATTTNAIYQPNAQQANYVWGTAELFKWKAYTGKITEGIVYKPENFDATKKYPMIVYFYERNNNTLFNYRSPSPTPSALNVPFFVSRGYVVFVPDIWYTKGKPGQSAYDYIVSGTRALVKLGFVDSTKMGLQGQSWGGYQTAYLIGKTNLYAAAWAGAPVVNMFSAYGGIRWESGVNRQMQYEKGQSRIGATIWERPDLYIENSPLFTIPKVKTPLVIMANDADGAVPWYQGIEYFTAMRRADKKVWMLNYNNEAHNLIERKNRKDIQIREQQFFDWLLKGEKPATWLAEGIPAIMKGRTWGLEVGK